MIERMQHRRAQMSFDMLVYFLELLLLLSYGLAYTGYFAKANAEQAKHAILLTKLVAYSDYIVKYGAAEVKDGVILSHKIDELKLGTRNPKLETGGAASGVDISINGGGICIQRLVIRAGEINTFGVCADA